MKDCFRLNVYVIAFSGVLATYISQPLLARPTKDWTYSLLVEESDVVCIGIMTSSKRSENTEFIPSHLDRIDSDIKVLAVLKGDPKQKGVNFVHFRYKRDSESILGNGPSFPVFDIALPGSSDNKKAASDRVGTKEEHATYLFFLKRRDDGAFGPASGNNDAVHSVARIAGFTWDDLRKNDDARPRPVQK